MEKQTHICTCKKCGKEYEVTCSDAAWKAGRYKHCCSLSCANSRPMTQERLDKIRNGIKVYYENQEYHYTCEKCGKEFVRKSQIKKGRHIHCNECKLQRVHVKEEPQSLLDLSSRTVSKILYRAKCSCSICGWNESSCDIHHIVPKSKGGTNDADNLIIVCPNCHRVIHTTDKYDIEYLKTLAVDKTFNNWREFYHTKN